MRRGSSPAGRRRAAAHRGEGMAAHHGQRNRKRAVPSGRRIALSTHWKTFFFFETNALEFFLGKQTHWMRASTGHGPLWPDYGQKRTLALRSSGRETASAARERPEDD